MTGQGASRNAPRARRNRRWGNSPAPPVTGIPPEAQKGQAVGAYRGLACRADERAEPAHDMDPAFLQQHRHGLADGVSGEAGLLHQRDLTGQLGPGG